MASSSTATGVGQGTHNIQLGDDYIADIQSTALPEPVLDVVNRYDRVFGERDRFLWKWIHSLFDAFTLSCVPTEQSEHVKTQKTIFTVFITILDDLAEKRGDTATFAQARRLPYCPETVDREADGVDTEVLEFTADVWDRFQSGIEDAPLRAEYAEVFAFDLRQALNAIDYTRLVNDHLPLANLEGATQYGAHNMVLFPYTDIDLMYSPRFDRSELGTLRDVVWEVQKLARIGNWLTTWERELDEGDFTAGTVVYALREGLISREELETGPTDTVDIAARIRQANVPDLFLAEWQRRYDAVRSWDFDATSVDLDRFVSGMETVLSYHLASQGYK